jgi:hypothetical protein
MNEIKDEKNKNKRWKSSKNSMFKVINHKSADFVPIFLPLLS